VSLESEHKENGLAAWPVGVDIAVQIASQAAGSGGPARSWIVRRLRPLGGAYYLVEIGEPHATTWLVTVDAETGQVTSTSQLPGTTEHITVDARRARQLAGADPEARVELVWTPSQISRSAVYPFWLVTMPDLTAVYVDQNGNVHRTLDSSRRQGGGESGTG
jgi:hypothetical protein